MTIDGGKVPFRTKGDKQKAIIEFECDQKFEGTEKGDASNEDPPKDDNGNTQNNMERSEDDQKSRALRFISYTREDDVQLLRLRWHTKWACDNMADEAAARDTHWGFFTWLLIM